MNPMRRTLVIVFALVASLIPIIGASAATGDPVLINEVLASTSGTDSEYIELIGIPGTSLDGLSFIEVESDDQASKGTIDHRFDFGPTDVIGDNGFFLAANALAESTYSVTSNFEIASNSLENSSATYALVETSSLSGDVVSGSEVVLDVVGSTDGEDASFFFFAAPVVGPDGMYFPAGVGRIVDGVDTDTVGDWSILSYSNDLAINTPTAGTGEEPPPPPPGPVLTLIHDIQGTGGTSPLVGMTVTVEGVVVADEETYDSLAGFFVQEEDFDIDADPLTSEGVFVFNANNDSVSIGDVVQVEGEVQERYGNTQLSNYAVVTVLDVEPRVATPGDVTFPLASIGDLEAFEGMAVTFTQTLAMSEYYNYDRYGEVVVGVPTEGFDRQMNPTALYEPGSPEGIALASENELSRITIDDGSNDQNPDVNVHPISRDEFSLTNRFRGGDAIGGLTGAIYYTYDEHKLYPNAYASYVPNERPASTAPAVGGRLQVATLNALNYFVTIDDGSNNCGPELSENCRGADSVDEFERQRAKLLEALVGLDADVVGLVELENTYGVEPLADIVAGLNAMLGAGTYDYIDAGVTGPDVIKVGVIYKPAAVTQIGQTAVLDTAAFLDPNNTGSDRNRAALGVSFLEKGTGEKFSIAVNHFKSKGSKCGGTDDSPYAGSCNVTRTLAARELLEWIGTNPTNAKDADWLIIGDLNSYDMEDPISVLRGGDYTDLVDAYEGESAYSFVYSGEWGYLDYALSSESLTGQVTRAAVWHVNADEPDIFDYDMSYKSPAQVEMYAVDPYRSSDHDAVIVGLSLSEKPGKGNHGNKPSNK